MWRGARPGEISCRDNSSSHLVWMLVLGGLSFNRGVRFISNGPQHCDGPKLGTHCQSHTRRGRRGRRRRVRRIREIENTVLETTCLKIKRSNCYLKKTTKKTTQTGTNSAGRRQPIQLEIDSLHLVLHYDIYIYMSINTDI